MIDVRMGQHEELKCPVQVGAAEEEVFDLIDERLAAVEFVVELAASVHKDCGALRLQDRRGPLPNVQEVGAHALRYDRPRREE